MIKKRPLNGDKVVFVKLDGSGEVDAVVTEVTGKTYTIDITYNQTSHLVRTQVKFSKDNLPGTIH